MSFEPICNALMLSLIPLAIIGVFWAIHRANRRP
jgi:hypothetical protein